MITRLEQLAGNERTRRSVTEMLRDGRVPQTLVIEGPAGSGRKTLARLIAAGLLCGKDQAPCGGCDCCGLVFSGVHPDVAAVASEEKKAAISVDQIRRVRMDAHILPGQGERKVFIIHGPMNDAAQNAFLKILEEPPAWAYFILLCNHRSELIDTVLSRSVVLSMGPVSYEEALPLLEKAGFADCQDTRLRWEQWGGLPGKLMTTQQEDSKLTQAVAASGAALAAGRREDFLRAVAPLVEDRTAYPGFLSGLYTLVRDALVAGLGGQATDPNALLLSRRLTPQQLMDIGEIINEERKKLVYNPGGWLFFTALCTWLFPRR